MAKVTGTVSPDSHQRGADELYCSSCGELIKSNVEVCPKCGVKYNYLAGVIGSGYSVVSLILGIFGLIFLGGLIIPGIFGLIFGIKGLKTEKKGIALVGIVLNSLQLFLMALLAVFLLILMKFLGAG